MAVQIVNFMPDADVHHGDPVGVSSAWLPSRDTVVASGRTFGRAGFMGVTIAIHVVALLAFLNVQEKTSAPVVEPMMASIIDAPLATEAPPPEVAPPPFVVPVEMVAPPAVTLESDAIEAAPQLTASTAISTAPQTVVPPMVETVEYVRAPAPVYPSESNRRRERGTVVLRVLVDPSGHAAQVRVETSSGYRRLDDAARAAVEKAVFRPHVVNGIAQAAQVLVPIEFERRAT